MVISYAILCHSETDSLRDLIEVIYQNKQEQDEIVIDDVSNSWNLS